MYSEILLCFMKILFGSMVHILFGTNLPERLFLSYVERTWRRCWGWFRGARAECWWRLGRDHVINNTWWRWLRRWWRLKIWLLSVLYYYYTSYYYNTAIINETVQWNCTYLIMILYIKSSYPLPLIHSTWKGFR